MKKKERIHFFLTIVEQIDVYPYYYLVTKSISSPDQCRLNHEYTEGYVLNILDLIDGSE